MPTPEPIPISKMSEIQQHFQSALSQTEGDVAFNVVLSFRFRHECVRNDADLPRIGEAKEWQELEPNKFLYFTHGQYANRDKSLAPHQDLALDHIAKELARKPTSRRALFSLLHTGDIVDTGDMPIPSLVLFQCSVVHNELIATTYFRALEAKQFLQINVAEFALWVRRLRDRHVSFDYVRWTIHAFQAYMAENSNCLRRPAASYSAVQICEVVSQRNYAALGQLIADFGCREAHLSLGSFETICEAVQTFVVDSPLVPRLVQARQVLRGIAAQTASHSFGSELDRLMVEFGSLVDELVTQSHDLATKGSA